MSTDHSLRYRPTDSNVTLQLSLKNNHAQQIDSSKIYSLTVLSLADVALETAATHGDPYIQQSSQTHATFTGFYPPSNIYFALTASGTHLPVYALTDTLRGMQELTHYLFFLEMTITVFSDANPTSHPIATGCLAFGCSDNEPLSARELQYANASATNVSAVPSRRLQSVNSPVQLTKVSGADDVTVRYSDLSDPLPIHGQSFADVADRILTNITDLVVANHGDGLLPFYGKGRRLFHVEDVWGSHLGISLLPYNRLGVDFTLAQAAMALRTTQVRLTHGPLVESKMEIYLDGAMIGWGCLRYTNTSAWRCLMPFPGTTSSVGSRKATFIFHMGRYVANKSTDSVYGAVPDVTASS